MSSNKTNTTSHQAGPATAEPLELTVLLPCRNEAETVGICVRKALETLQQLGVSGEVLVVDNGSTDGSGRIAQQAGARVLYEPRPGYGHALLTGIEQARGRFILMADADDSYDLTAIEPFLQKLREGYDLVQGCRLPSGGGSIQPGAMPWLHRWIGNPFFSWLARWWFGVPVHDINCGMRAFRRDFILSLDLRCTGMEFANEMLIKATLYGARITEVPITLRPDARRSRRPHLRTFRDGWRTLRFYLLYSPRWLFLIPGAFLIGMGIGLQATPWYFVDRPASTLLPFSLLGTLGITIGYQSILFALLTKAFAINEGLLPMDKRMERFFRIMNLERGLLLGAMALVAGIGLLFFWHENPAHPFALLRYGLPGVTLCTLGAQTILFSFFASLLGLRRR